MYDRNAHYVDLEQFGLVWLYKESTVRKRVSETGPYSYVVEVYEKNKSKLEDSSIERLVSNNHQTGPITR